MIKSSYKTGVQKVYLLNSCFLLQTKISPLLSVETDNNGLWFYNSELRIANSELKFSE